MLTYPVLIRLQFSGHLRHAMTGFTMVCILQYVYVQETHKYSGHFVRKEIQFECQPDLESSVSA